jgi:hypothetical protein
MTDLPETTLERALVDYVLELSWILDDLPDHQMDPDTAVKVQEDIAALVNLLAPWDQARFLKIGTRLAAEADPARARRIREAIDAIGLQEHDSPDV